ncbi:flagellar motor protein MotB [Emcibacter nanhaiensis]|uniref:Flagellar motor protein MotB n=1 Tax=Emcibacter nanhaiensis TaxID=1505037 RepID=A0A501PQ98_9PROT|nr:flagellar motor protein MotB [Emcibacter nanhaiensis]TPD62699.1 flagellar motor protein MotB [Emcibacter nanhaiensis]
MADEQRPIIIKRIKKVSGGGHGGAWKVAYADFVTAMMAFFLLLWLMNATTEEQRSGLADYFSPTSASTSSSSGAGDILGGVSLNTDGAQSSAVTVSIPDQSQTLIKKQDGEGGENQTQSENEEQSFEELMAQREQDFFEEMSENLRQSIQDSPELAELQDQLLIDITEDGMRIQLVDKDNRAMFKPGTADLYGYAEKMIEKVSGVIEKMPNRISISGHTDSSNFAKGADYTNWELSADRANASRRVLLREGVPSDRFAEVLGKADTEPLLPDRPRRAENRRITILLLREAPTLPRGFL